ncbi:hypothetical protein PybrP1_012178 [[Pythium] brassicae (nom. inval.)]|nr:hypothetical protein PybrP1_012178 [[Pythium] brassicae (nom. inval.)]
MDSRRQPPAFIDTSALAQLRDDDDSAPNSSESPVTVDALGDVDMSFRASHSQSGSRRGNGNGSSMAGSTLGERLTMMNIPTQQLRGTVYYGWLWKKGSSFKTWKKRFFLLHGRALTYYSQCCVIASDLLGTQCLDVPAKGGLRVASATLSSETEFGLKVTSSSGRVLYIQAGDCSARMQWLEVLEDAPRKRFFESTMRATTMSEMTSSRSNPPLDFSMSANDMASMSTMSDSESEGDAYSDGDKRGWLQLRTGMLHSWKKRYVTFSDGHITVSTHRRSKRPHDKTYGVLSCVAFAGHPHAFCVRLDRNKELFMAAASEKEAEAWIDAFTTGL